MARRLGRDGWPGLEYPPDSDESWFDTGDSRNRASAGGTARGKKFQDFKLTETGPNILL